MRYLNGETVTDLLYTGQKLDSYINLYWYGSRWYDASIGHFIQPDTIIPDPTNSINSNRYAYVNYNPLKFNDPTGHNGENPWDEDPLGYLYGYANEQLMRTVNGEVTDLEAMALIVDQAATVYKGNLDDMMPALTEVFMGTSQTGGLALIASVMHSKNVENGGCGGVGRNEHDCPSNEYHFGDTGFHNDFRDGDNQIFHSWGYVSQTYSKNKFVHVFNYDLAIGANVFHEYIQGISKIQGGWGASWQDFVLSQEAMYLGDDLTMGRVSGYELADAIRKRFGVTGPGSNGRLQRLIKFKPELSAK